MYPNKLFLACLSHSSDISQLKYQITILQCTLSTHLTRCALFNQFISEYKITYDTVMYIIHITNYLKKIEVKHCHRSSTKARITVNKLETIHCTSKFLVAPKRVLNL